MKDCPVCNSTFCSCEYSSGWVDKNIRKLMRSGIVKDIVAVFLFCSLAVIIASGIALTYMSLLGHQ